MAIPESHDSNILDAETINVRLIVYPILAAAVLVVGGFGYYYYQQNQRAETEAQARVAITQAKSPEALVQVADKFPNTDQATVALLNAADASFTKHDFAAAITDYQRLLSTPTTDAELRDSAQLGLASSLEASGKGDDAINAYLEVAHRGEKSAYAPFAYNAAAGLYEKRGDKDNERKILTEAASSGATDSLFVKQMQARLKQLNASSIPPLTVPVNPTPAPAPADKK